MPQPHTASAWVLPPKKRSLSPGPVCTAQHDEELSTQSAWSEAHSTISRKPSGCSGTAEPWCHRKTGHLLSCCPAPAVQGEGQPRYHFPAGLSLLLFSGCTGIQTHGFVSPGKHLPRSYPGPATFCPSGAVDLVNSPSAPHTWQAQGFCLAELPVGRGGRTWALTRASSLAACWWGVTRGQQEAESLPGGLQAHVEPPTLPAWMCPPLALVGEGSVTRTGPASPRAQTTGRRRPSWGPGQGWVPGPGFPTAWGVRVQARLGSRGGSCVLATVGTGDTAQPSLPGSQCHRNKAGLTESFNLPTPQGPRVITSAPAGKEAHRVGGWPRSTAGSGFNGFPLQVR